MTMPDWTRIPLKEGCLREPAADQRLIIWVPRPSAQGMARWDRIAASAQGGDSFRSRDCLGCRDGFGSPEAGQRKSRGLVPHLGQFQPGRGPDGSIVESIGSVRTDVRVAWPERGNDKEINEDRL